MSNCVTIVNNKLERMCKEMVTVNFRILSPELAWTDSLPSHVILSWLYMESEPRTSQSLDSKTLKSHTSWYAWTETYIRPGAQCLSPWELLAAANWFWHKPLGHRFMVNASCHVVQPCSGNKNTANKRQGKVTLLFT
jgi:hypothetical protein